MSGSTTRIALLTILGALALGPLIWFVATVLAPALLPVPQSEQMQLIPVHPVPSGPPPVEAIVRTADAGRPHRGTPEPIAERWRFRADGSLELLPDGGSSSSAFPPITRSQP